MIKTILKFLIALIAPSTLTVIYIFSENRIVKLLSTDSTGELSKTLLRSGLGVSSIIIIALSYWILDLKEELKKHGDVLSFDKTQSLPSKFAFAPESTKDIAVDDLIWTAQKYSSGLIGVDNIPRCKNHDLMLTYDGHSYHCPETINGNCNLDLSTDGLSRLKRIATSYIDKQFRDEPSPDKPTIKQIKIKRNQYG